MIDLATEFKPVTCGECGGTYALPERYVRQKREKGGFWNCPFCRVGWGYTLRESKVSRLERELSRERAAHDQTRADRDYRERRRRAEKAAKTRLKTRIANGVCPCCGRSFQNLRRHMASKHPEFCDA